MTQRIEHQQAPAGILSPALHEGDCREIIPRLVAEGVVVDAVVTDPPYHLESIVKRFGAKNAALATSPAHARMARGFMGLTWDGGDIAFKPETWAAVLSILRPGGYLLAFGGTRTYHRIACAIEDAGFVVQDQIDWIYGSGFPKGRRQLKPAHEPICVAYKPGGKCEFGIDECRIEYEVTPNPATNPFYRAQNGYRTQVGSDSGGPSSWTIKPNGGEITPHPAGRWPANVILDGSPEVEEAFAGHGKPKDSAHARGGVDFRGNERFDRHLICGHSDAGTAARFFYSAKADKQDRWGSKHPTVKPVELIRYLVRLVTPPGGTFLDCFAGSGTAAVAALAENRNAILIEQDPAYCADIRERITHYDGNGRHSLASKARHQHASNGTLL
jgi:site-specific DNA-methyltransferase (adenine-specific)